MLCQDILYKEWEIVVNCKLQDVHVIQFKNGLDKGILVLKIPEVLGYYSYVFSVKTLKEGKVLKFVTLQEGDCLMLLSLL